MRPLPHILLGLVLIPLLAGCGVGSIFEVKSAVPPGGSGTDEAMSEGERAWAFEILDLLNAERAAHELPPLAWSEEASQAAYIHSQDMHYRDFFAHVNPDGEDPGDRMVKTGVEYGLFGENIARGYESPAQVMAAWMDSPGHRANILEPRFTHVGIGIHTYDSGGPWWTQDFFN